MRSFWLAIQFLTRLPTPSIDSPSDKEYGDAIYHYPFVGFILGFLLFTIASFVQAAVTTPADASTDVAAIIILIAWVLLTGALHIDGLADSADAWIGGYGNKTRTLNIMKDPTCGPAGVTSIILLLIMKFALIKLCFSEGLHFLIAAPLIGRTGVQVLIATTKYARDEGLASAMNEHLSINKVVVCLSVTAIFLFAYFPTLYLLLSILFCGMAWWALRYLMIKRINGYTGDTAGAWIEVTECVCLLPLLWL